jgi:hypothetical protein
MVAPGGTNITTTDPRLGPNPPQVTPPLQGAATATQGATNAQLGAQDALVAGGRTPLFYSNGVGIFGNGGGVAAPTAPTATTAPAVTPPATTGTTAAADPRISDPGLYGGLSGFNTDGTLRLAPNDPDAASLMAKYPGRYRVGFSGGGLIPEPVIGIGQQSGQTYEFGEKGTEAVVPNDIFEKLMQSAGEVDYSEDTGKKKRRVKVNRYASGGTIGYNPGNTPSLGSQSADFFNDPRLQQVVAQGFNSSPQTPLFPQIGVATNGGQSLVASSQRLNSLLPSEQSVYAGTLRDEFGAQPDDVFALARKLAPQVSGLRTPRYVN